MREIIFRGKRVRDGKWVEGFFCNESCDDFTTETYEEANIIRKGTGFWHPVDPSTVGQFTGLTDKNGKKIFEGDIVKTHYKNTRKNDFVEQVVFHNGRFCAMYKMSEYGRMWANLPDGVPRLPQDKTPYMEWCEVIGNIHDNPELMEVQECH